MTLATILADALLLLGLSILLPLAAIDVAVVAMVAMGVRND